MNKQQQSLEELQHIKNMMERSSRFISLSGLSGVAAGVCALVGAWAASQKINCWIKGDCELSHLMQNGGINLMNELLWIATLTFIAAFISAFIFTWIRSKKDGQPMWGHSSKRLLINTAIPLLTGAIFLFRMLQMGEYNLIAPGCLIFYGLALVNAGKYTVGEVRFLGMGMIVLGIMNCWYVGYGLYFWAMGFGLLHILYGIVMWYKYERKQEIRNEK